MIFAQVLYKRKEMEGGGRERVFSKQVKKVLGCIQPHVIQVASLTIDSARPKIA
jgi:hypothetical protein